MPAGAVLIMIPGLRAEKQALIIIPTADSILRQRQRLYQLFHMIQTRYYAAHRRFPDHLTQTRGRDPAQN